MLLQEVFLVQYIIEIKVLLIIIIKLFITQ